MQVTLGDLVRGLVGHYHARMFGLRDRLFTVAEARGVGLWMYDPPYDVYNLSRDDAVKLLIQRDEHGNGFCPVREGDDVAGFVCFGPEGRVSGQAEEVGTCDIGAGLIPLSHWPPGSLPHLPANSAPSVSPSPGSSGSQQGELAAVTG